MKKKFNILLLVLVYIICLTFKITVKASDKIIENEGATYRVTNTIEKFDLGYGITYQREDAFTTVKEGHYSGAVAGYGSSDGFQVGKDYHQEVNVLQIDYSSEAQLIPYAYLRGAYWNVATVRAAAKEFENSNPGYMVIAAVNGDWFKINEDYKASSGVTISNGEYYKTSSSYGGNPNIIIIDNDNKSKRLSETSQRDVVPVLTIYDNNGNELSSFNIDRVNEEPSDNQISLFYASHKDSSENYTDKFTSIEVNNAWVVDKAEVSVSTMYGSFYGKGKVEKITNNTAISNGKFAIKTTNKAVESLLNNDVIIRCQYEFKDESLKNVKNAISYPYKVMENGKAIYPSDEGMKNDGKTRKPRTMLGQKADGSLFLAQVDGRQQKVEKYGLTQMEMGAIFEYYGCVEGWKLDGGGSSTMIIRKQSGLTISSSFNNVDSNDWYVVNSPSDGNERNDGNCLLVVIEVPQAQVDVEKITSELIVFQINLISLIDKYDELCLIANGEEYLVIDGKVTVSGLKQKEVVEIYLYGKKDDQYYYLGIREKITSALLKPTQLSIDFDTTIKDDKKVVVIYYQIDNSEAIERICVVINDKETFTHSQKQTIDFSRDLIYNINDLKVKLYISVSEYADDEIIEFINIEKRYSLDFILDEMLYTNSSIYDNIFNVE